MAKKKTPKTIFLKDLFGQEYYAELTPTRKGVILGALKRIEKKETIPEAGHLKYFVLCNKLCIYTSMGADNLHHASNKATKLWGPHWSRITQEHSYGRGYQFVCVKQFGELLRTLT